MAIENALDGYAVPILETCTNASSRTVPLSQLFRDDHTWDCIPGFRVEAPPSASVKLFPVSFNLNIHFLSWVVAFSKWAKIPAVHFLGP